MFLVVSHMIVRDKPRCVIWQHPNFLGNGWIQVLCTTQSTISVHGRDHFLRVTLKWELYRRKRKRFHLPCTCMVYRVITITVGFCGYVVSESPRTSNRKPTWQWWQALIPIERLRWLDIYRLASKGETFSAVTTAMINIGKTISLPLHIREVTG